MRSPANCTGAVFARLHSVRLLRERVRICVQCSLLIKIPHTQKRAADNNDVDMGER